MSRPVLLTAAGALLAATFFASWIIFLTNAPLAIHPAIEIDISPGQSPAEIARQLESLGVVRSARALVLMARFGRKDRQIRYGRHRFEGAMTPGQVLLELTRSARPTVRVTIPEGLRWTEIGKLLEKRGIASAKDYARAVCDPGFLILAGAGDGANCAEGYLFPDTYRFSQGMRAEEIVRLQLERFQQVIAGLLEGFVPTADDATDVLIRRTVILASIIEKETSRAGERAIVSSVFHNRLRRGMRLQADPTVIYGLLSKGRPFDGRLRSKDLHEATPYNTYQIHGLPPGPICNPGRGALEAALEPAASKYLYFVAKGDGTHVFSSTLAAHNRAVHARLN